MSDIVDTTEMYIKSIYELSEDSVVPMRARIVERLKQSGPTVSETVARLEHNGLVKIDSDRHLSLTPEGLKIAKNVVTKHRYVERLLVDKLGYPWEKAHEEACKWEHVVGDDLLEYLSKFLGSVKTDPYGNLVPLNNKNNCTAKSLVEFVTSENPIDCKVVRLGEPVQADTETICACAKAEIFPNSRVEVSLNNGIYSVKSKSQDLIISMDKSLARHFFVE